MSIKTLPGYFINETPATIRKALEKNRQHLHSQRGPRLH